MSFYTLAFITLLAGKGICADFQKTDGAQRKTPYNISAWLTYRRVEYNFFSKQDLVNAFHNFD